eukprot:gene13716-biopygen6974
MSLAAQLTAKRGGIAAKLAASMPLAAQRGGMGHGGTVAALTPFSTDGDPPETPWRFPEVGLSSRHAVTQQTAVVTDGGDGARRSPPRDAAPRCSGNWDAFPE